MYKPREMYSNVKGISTRMGKAILLTGLAAAVASCVTAGNPMPEIDLSGQYNLSGNWRHISPDQGSKPTVRIAQTGSDIKGVWERYTFNCRKGDTWFEGEMHGNHATGTRYLCSGGTDKLDIVVDKEGKKIYVRVIVNGFPETDVLQKVN
ncbi:hypothetical protein HYU09_00720 [Candidatus Woesearchaeota archaeon]|nr:hypothetical protein [Candidatus Woesearchaeota archaeon]